MIFLCYMNPSQTVPATETVLTQTRSHRPPIRYFKLTYFTSIQTCKGSVRLLTRVRYMHNVWEMYDSSGPVYQTDFGSVCLLSSCRRRDSETRRPVCEAGSAKLTSPIGSNLIYWPCPYAALTIIRFVISAGGSVHHLSEVILHWYKSAWFAMVFIQTQENYVQYSKRQHTHAVSCNSLELFL